MISGKLINEIINDPEEIGYDSMSDEEVTASLNAVNRPRNKTSMTGSEILNAIVVGEYTVLTVENKQLFWDIIHLGTVNPFGVEAIILTNIFGGGSGTISALADDRIEFISRATEIGVGWVKVGYVKRIRRT